MEYSRTRGFANVANPVGCNKTSRVGIIPSQGFSDMGQQAEGIVQGSQSLDMLYIIVFQEDVTIACIGTLFRAAENFAFRIISFVPYHYLEIEVSQASLASFFNQETFLERLIEFPKS